MTTQQTYYRRQITRGLCCSCPHKPVKNKLRCKRCEATKQRAMRAYQARGRTAKSKDTYHYYE